MFLRDLEDFGAFYERNYQTAYRTAYGIVGDAATAADVTQDAFLNAYKRREGFRGEAPASAWLIRIVVNGAIAARRRPAVVSLELDEPAVAEGVGHGERLDLVRALSKLSQKQRAAVVLRYYHGFDYESIAGILTTSSGNVGSLLNRAVSQLRRDMSGVSTPLAIVDHQEVRDVR